MTTINQLSEADTLQNGDQFPIFSEAQGDTRKVNFLTLKDAVAEEFVSLDDLAAQTGAGLVGTADGTTVQQELDSKADNTFIQAGTGTVARTPQNKMRDLVATQDFSSHAVADAAGVELYNAANVTSTIANGASVVANQWGPGRVTTADGNKRGKWFSSVSSRPSPLGNQDSIETAFNGDLSHSIFQIEHRLTGSATLSQPTSGYVYTPEAYPFYGVLYNSSGYNHQTGGNDGRTGACFSRISVKQYGQGDAVAYNASVLIAAQKSGATHFLAQPAGVLFNGDMHCAVDYVYMNPREFMLDDDGYDVAAIGDVVNMNRSNATGGQSCWWGAYRLQSIGTAAINNIISGTGKVNTGLDFAMSGLDFGANKAAISLKAGDRFYLNNASSNDNFTTTFNGDYIEYASGSSAINVVAGGSSIARFGASLISFTRRINLNMSNVLDFADDAAAAAGGLNIGDVYRTGSILKARVS